MKRFNILSWATAVLLVVVLAPTTMAAGLPDLGEGNLSVLDNGREYIRWQMQAEYERVHLTLSTPCGIIQRTYEAGEDPFFEISELEPDDPTGSYNWQLRIEPYVDPSIRKALNEARAKGDQEMVRSLRRKGLLPEGPFIQSGFFEVDREGGIVDFTQVEKQGLQVQLDNGDGVSQASNPLGLVTEEAQIISPDGVVYNSLCVGFDCPNNPTFGADTIRLQENNLRIHADDTSTASSFPNQDWRLEFNSNVNGGGEYFRVIDATASRNIMTIEANAPSHSLYVESSGELGVGTSNPVLEVHAVSGDSPGLRLEQDVSSGFAAQSWDIVGNETSFFVRDATNGSTLPFRVFPGSASNALVVRDGRVGVGTTSPDTKLEVEDSSEPTLRLTDTGGESWDIQVTTGGNLAYEATGTTTNFLLNNNGRMTVNSDTAGALTFDLKNDGDLIITGDLTANGTNYPSSRTLKEGFSAVDNREVLQRLSRVPVSVWTYKSDTDKQPHIGPVTEDFSAAFDFLQVDGKLNTIDLHGVAMAAIQGLNEVVSEKDARILELEQRLAAIEAQLSEADTTQQ